MFIKHLNGLNRELYACVQRKKKLISEIRPLPSVVLHRNVKHTVSVPQSWSVSNGIFSKSVVHATSWHIQRSACISAACLSNARNRRGGSITCGGRYVWRRSINRLRDTSPFPSQFERQISSSLFAHIISDDNWCTRDVLCCNGVNSLRKTCKASNTRPSSKYSRYFCSNTKNFIS